MLSEEGNMRELLYYSSRVFFLGLEGITFQSPKLFGDPFCNVYV
jgi:hypothetical protein